MEYFFENGAVITFNDQKTYFAQDFTINDDPSELYFTLPEFNLKNLNQFYHPQKIESDRPDILNKNLDDKVSLSWNWIGQWHEYTLTYDFAIQAIKSGQLKKAVPFVEFKTKKPLDFNQKILPEILKKVLAQKNTNQFIYGYWDTNSGFIGLTPEILLQKRGFNKYYTMALAGTLPISDTTDMLKDAKLFEEHQFVIKDLSEKLKDHVLNWGPSVEKKYGILKHIYTEAEFESLMSLESLIQRLSPTSALGVYPSGQMQNYQNILKPSQRGSFGAPFGLVRSNEAQVLVCLRGLFWDEQSLKIFVGGGVTAQSDYNTEVKELKLKFESTKLKLGLL